jgi:hypothetical protein
VPTAIAQRFFSPDLAAELESNTQTTVERPLAERDQT